MRYLIDTSIWLWSVAHVKRLNAATLEVLSDPRQEIYFSAASVWEIAIKAALGKLHLPGPPATVVPRETERLGLRPLPVDSRHALAVYDLPVGRGDPFDRLLVAQSDRGTSIDYLRS